jgi:hypothetical protein
MKTSFDEMIMSVTATPMKEIEFPDGEKSRDGSVRLKYLAIAGGCGPEITLDRDLALQTIAALQAALEGKAYDSERDYHN